MVKHEESAHRRKGLWRLRWPGICSVDQWTYLLWHLQVQQCNLNANDRRKIKNTEIASVVVVPQSPLPTSYQHCSCCSWLSTCWPFSSEFLSSLSEIYRLLHCLQIQSKSSPFLWSKYLWPLAISIHSLLIRHVDYCILKLYYIMLCHVYLIMNPTR